MGGAVAATSDGTRLAVGGPAAAAIVDGRGVRRLPAPGAPSFAGDGVGLYVAGPRDLAVASQLSRRVLGTIALGGTALAVQGGLARTIGTDGPDVVGGTRLPDRLDGGGGRRHALRRARERRPARR